MTIAPIRRVSCLTGGKRVVELAWSHDGSMLAASFKDRAIRVWAGNGGKWGSPQVFRGHSNWVHSVSWSPDGKWLASAAEDQTIRIWDLVGRNSPRVLKHPAKVYAVSWSHHSTHLACGVDDRRMWLWDGANARLLGRVEEHSGYVRSVAWHPKSQMVASGGVDGSILVTRIDDANHLASRRFESGTGHPLSLTWSPQGEFRFPSL